jgi:hypothetical protein
MTTTRTYQLATIHPDYGVIGHQTRLTLPEAQSLARSNNASNLRNGRVERYIVEHTRTARRMDAMVVAA